MQQLTTEPDGSNRGWSLLVLGALLFSVPLCVVGLRHAHFDGEATNSTDLAGGQESASGSDHLLVSWRGSRVDDPRIPLFARQLLGTPGADGLLRGGSPLFSEVITPGQILGAFSPEDVAAEEAARRISGLWLGHGGVKLRLTEAGRRDLNWTTRRIQSALAETGIAGDAEIVLRAADQSGAALSDEGGGPSLAIPGFDLEIELPDVRDRLIEVQELQTQALAVRGFATADEPAGQRLVEDAFVAIGSPVAIHTILSPAGRVSVPEAAAAIRSAAEAAGVREGDLLLAGKPLEASLRAAGLRSLVWSEAGGVPSALGSPVQLGLLAAAMMWLLLCRFSMPSVVSCFAAALCTGGFAATINVVGLAWTESMLSLPPAIFLLTLACRLLDDKRVDAGVEGAARPVSLPVVLSVISVVAMVCVTDLSTAGGRQFAIAATLGVSLAWFIATAVVPSLEGLFPSGEKGCRIRAADFATWAGTHRRAAGIIAALSVGVCATLLLQPSVRNWVTAQSPITAPTRDAIEIERSLVGMENLTIQIRFSDEAQQRMRFVDRVNIVRSAAEEVRKCSAVTGAMSLADLAPEVAPLPDDARSRDRAAYVRRSNEVESRLLECNRLLGAGWISSPVTAAGQDAVGMAMGPEIWRIDVAMRRGVGFSAESHDEAIHAAMQNVFRFHAGVSHSLIGDSSVAQSAPNRRPRVTAILLAAGVLGGMLALSSLPLGLVLAMACIVPPLALAYMPGLSVSAVGAPDWIGLTLPAGIALMCAVHLVRMCRRTHQSSGDPIDAAANALASSGTEIRALMVASLVVCLPVACLGPDFAQGSARLMFASGIWGLVASGGLVPLLLPGAMARQQGLASAHASEASIEVTLPVRVDPAGPTTSPHLELQTARRRTRHAS